MSARPNTDSTLAGVRLRLEATTPEGAIGELVATLSHGPLVLDPAQLLVAALARERDGGTWLGHGLALPHARSDAASGLVAAVGLSPAGIPWGPGGERAHIVVFAGVPKAQVRAYLEFLRRLTIATRDESQARAWLDAADEHAFRAAWSRAMNA